jgi:hypothetical protein
MALSEPREELMGSANINKMLVRVGASDTSVSHSCSVGCAVS